MALYEKYKKLNIDGSRIGLERGSEIGGYFCTPKGARVIGWDNGIHYCFVRGYGEMVFVVNPEPGADKYVYPLAENFEDFLRLILACGHTAPWSRSSFGRKNNSRSFWQVTITHSCRDSRKYWIPSPKS